MTEKPDLLLAAARMLIKEWDDYLAKRYMGEGLAVSPGEFALRAAVKGLDTPPESSYWCHEGQHYKDTPMHHYGSCNKPILPIPDITLIDD